MSAALMSAQILMGTVKGYFLGEMVNHIFLCLVQIIGVFGNYLLKTQFKFISSQRFEKIL